MNVLKSFPGKYLNIRFIVDHIAKIFPSNVDQIKWFEKWITYCNFIIVYSIFNLKSCCLLNHFVIWKQGKIKIFFIFVTSVNFSYLIQLWFGIDIDNRQRSNIYVSKVNQNVTTRVLKYTRDICDTLANLQRVSRVIIHI